jgi:hypothetical protein
MGSIPKALGKPLGKPHSKPIPEIADREPRKERRTWELGILKSYFCGASESAF